MGNVLRSIAIVFLLGVSILAIGIPMEAEAGSMPCYRHSVEVLARDCIATWPGALMFSALTTFPILLFNIALSLARRN